MALKSKPNKIYSYCRSKLLFTFFLVALFIRGEAKATFCPNLCTCDDETLEVSCIGANLDVIPIALNPSIQRIVLKDNKIKAVEAAAFQFYGDLKAVDLSNNHLFSIPNGSFEAQKQLIELHLKHNKLSSINENTFLGLKSLTILNLRDNYLEILRNGFFNSLSKLQEIDLGQNRISHVESNAFQKLVMLRVLYLDDNQLRVIPSNALGPLNALAELHIGLNAFTSLINDGFEGLDRLTVLDVSGAGLDNITEKAFKGLSALRVLKLNGNKLKEIPTKQLSLLLRLEELVLGQNLFTDVKTAAFQGLFNLKKLDISGAKMLTTIQAGAFSDNSNLETLILNSNKLLTEMEDGALAGLPNLRHLLLRDNAFTGFSESLVSWNELRRLDIAENMLMCDCRILWLAEVLVSRNSSPVLCSEPVNMKGKPLKGMQPDELGCAFFDPRKQALLATLCVAGIALTFGIGLILYYRFRRRVRDVLTDYKWSHRAISRKEHEYRKTFSEEEYIVRAAHTHHHNSQSQHYLQQQSQLSAHQLPTSNRPVPVTEL